MTYRTISSEQARRERKVNGESGTQRGLAPRVHAYQRDGLTITPYPVVHTSHPAYGYLIEANGRQTT